MNETTADTAATHSRDYYAEAADKETSYARDWLASQGALNRRREAEVKSNAAKAICQALEDDIRSLGQEYSVPLSYRVRLMKQARAMEDLINL
tara:strand:- start:1245 stop:1523 length:279 start_codon:yes stop_codon:yes gene_type:complete